jgi:hypothetical protein
MAKIIDFCGRGSPAEYELGKEQKTFDAKYSAYFHRR